MDKNLLTLALFITQIITIIVSVTGFVMVKCNDLKHLKEDVKKLDDKLINRKIDIKELSKIVTEIAKIQAKRIGICEARHEK